MNYQNLDPSKLKSGHHRWWFGVVLLGVAIVVTLFVSILNAGGQTLVIIHVPPAARVLVDNKTLSPCEPLQAECPAATKSAATKPTTYRWFSNTDTHHKLVVTVGGETVEHPFRTTDVDLTLTVSADPTNDLGSLRVREGRSTSTRKRARRQSSDRGDPTRTRSNPSPRGRLPFWFATDVKNPAIYPSSALQSSAPAENTHMSHLSAWVKIAGLSCGSAQHIRAHGR